MIEPDLDDDSIVVSEETPGPRQTLFLLSTLGSIAGVSSLVDREELIWRRESKNRQRRRIREPKNPVPVRFESPGTITLLIFDQCS
jgi:hypothetical protein